MKATSHASFRHRAIAGRSLIGLLMLAISALPALAEEGDDEAMDEDPAMSIACDDGTTLAATFGEADVQVTLGDGKTVTLAQRDGDNGFMFSNGDMTLSGDESSLSWTAAGKPPVGCHVADQAPLLFDEPLTVDTAQLPKDPANPEADPQVNCYRFAGFMVKEVDLGEKGAASLSIARPDAACERNPGKDEKLIQDDLAGYFFGVKGSLVFLQGADGFNGGVPFVVYDSTSMKRLFDDSFEGNDFETLDVQGLKVDMSYRRVYAATCSLYLDGGSCAETVRKATGLGTADAALPDCGPAYVAEAKRTPHQAKQIETLPSVITYEAHLVYDGTTLSITPRQGETACSVPD